jgi:hypothetical protein
MRPDESSGSSGESGIGDGGGSADRTSRPEGPSPSQDLWMRRILIAVVAGVAVIVVVLVVIGAVVVDAVNSSERTPQARQAPSGASPPSPPGTPSPARRPSEGAPANPAKRTPRPTPTITRLAWRTEILSNGSELLVVGDVDAVPRDPASVSASDYHAAEEAGEVKAVKVRGWWCITRVDARLSVSGGFLRNAGFSTRCSGRPGRMRQYYRFERSSWTGMRPYTDDRVTAWTGGQTQPVGAQAAPCPAGRTGTYDYRLRVALEIDGFPAGDVPALSNDEFRGDCGTGTS